jgi:hypothetical protein
MTRTHLDTGRLDISYLADGFYLKSVGTLKTVVNDDVLTQCKTSWN